MHCGEWGKTNTCPTGFTKRHEHDGHRAYGSTPQNECCLGTCHESFTGTCPPGKVNRGADDYHSCKNMEGTWNECDNADHCCETPRAYCKEWNGTCPAGKEKRGDDDMHQCSDGSCDADDCCGVHCGHWGKNESNTCPPGTQKRSEHDGHRAYGAAVTNECCVKTCHANYQGECPAGKQVRPENDMHDCGDRCDQADECCETPPAICRNWKVNNASDGSVVPGTCPAGLTKRSDDDEHHCRDNICNEQECCKAYCSGYFANDAYNLQAGCPAGTFKRHSSDRSECPNNVCSNEFCCGNDCRDWASNNTCPAKTKLYPNRGHMYFGGDDPQQRCCLSTCDVAFTGTCTGGKQLRPPDDYHQCKGTHGDHTWDRCDEESDCCKSPSAYCTAFTGTCPAGTKQRRADDTHECGGGICSTSDCCVAICSEWKADDGSAGTCPAGKTKRHIDDWHHCQGGKCNENECCITTCKGFTGTCPAGSKKRSDNDHSTCPSDNCNVDFCCGYDCFDGSVTCDASKGEKVMPFGQYFKSGYSWESKEERCCIATCDDNFKGTCPAGKLVLTDPWHHCGRDGQKCDESACCRATCKAAFTGTCPAGTQKRSDLDSHDCAENGGTCGVSECCVKTCHLNFKGTCPAGQKVRGKWDLRDCGDDCDQAQVCCKEPEKCDPNAGVKDTTMTHSCDEVEIDWKDCDAFKKSVICSDGEKDGCYANCWSSATNVDWKQTVLKDSVKCADWETFKCPGDTTKIVEEEKVVQVVTVKQTLGIRGMDKEQIKSKKSNIEAAIAESIGNGILANQVKITKIDGEAVSRRRRLLNGAEVDIEYEVTVDLDSEAAATQLQTSLQEATKKTDFVQTVATSFKKVASIEINVSKKSEATVSTSSETKTVKKVVNADGSDFTYTKKGRVSRSNSPTPAGLDEEDLLSEGSKMYDMGRVLSITLVIGTMFSFL